MHFTRWTNRRLYDEHAAVRRVLAPASTELASTRWPAAAEDPAFRQALTAVATALAGEVSAHFRFEERELFPRLRDEGEDELVEMMLAEHAEIETDAETLRGLLETVGPLTEESFRALRAAGLSVCERLFEHSEREDAALLPVLETVLDEDSDAAALAAYG